MPGRGDYRRRRLTTPGTVNTGNLFEAVPDSLDQEQFTLLAKGKGVRILRIVSTGQSDPPDAWQDPEDDEWVVLLSGSARLLFNDGDRRHDMTSGDWCHIPAGTVHRVEFTDLDEPSIWIAVHFT